MARLSSLVMIVLGAISMLLSIRHPLSPSFLVSVAVLVIGIIEWRAGQALRALDEKAPGRLAINQMALGVAIAIYAMYKGLSFDPSMVDDLLDRETIAPLLDLYPPDVVSSVRDMLPRLVPLMYYFIGAVAMLGAWATARFYRSRLQHVVALLKSN